LIIPKKIRNDIYEYVNKYSPNETKGALFAEKLDDETYKVEAVYFEKKVGTFAFVTLFNNERYKKFCANYFNKYKNQYEIHNYIGDWHSHPSFSCVPSLYDKNEVIKDLKNSNANFLIQLIVKIEKNCLVGNAFLYNNQVTALKIKLIIE
jgi:proteasome lid subunit RPN8/RPN11